MKCWFFKRTGTKKSASSPDEAALLGKKYHIAAKINCFGELCKYFDVF